MHQRPERTHHILQIGVMFSLRFFPRLKIDNVLSGRPTIHTELVTITNLDEVIFSVILDGLTEGLDIFLEHIEFITEEYTRGVL